MTRYERPNIEAMQGYTWGEQPDDDQTIVVSHGGEKVFRQLRFFLASSGVALDCDASR